jgi:DeoR/GlpR family transcriptional regulator of sugar metabolism
VKDKVLQSQRQTYILSKVRQNGAVRVSQLVKELNVSDMTVRRDLEDLAERGLLEKVHGGATSVPDGASYEPSFAAKSTRLQREKESIAELAARLVRPGTAIGISAGTTTYQVARYLIDVPGLTIVTNSTQVADLLYQAPGESHTVLLTGGMRTPSDALVGPFAVSALQTTHLDLVFMGVHGMDAKSGFTTPNLLEAETNRALIAAGRSLVVTADHTKWGLIGISSIARLDEANTLITDAGIPLEAQAILKENVGELVIAPISQTA